MPVLVGRGAKIRSRKDLIGILLPVMPLDLPDQIGILPHMMHPPSPALIGTAYPATPLYLQDLIRSFYRAMATVTLP